MSKLMRNDPVIFHYRNRDDNNVTLPRGGVTVVFDPETKLMGVAVCSKKDTYNRRLGRKICTNRILAENRGPHVHSFSYSDEVTIEDVRESAAFAAEFSKIHVQQTHGYSSIDDV